MQCRESFLQEKDVFLKKERTQCIFEKRVFFMLKHNFRSLKCPPDVDWIMLVFRKNPRSNGIQYTFKDAVSFLSPPHKRQFAKIAHFQALVLFWTISHRNRDTSMILFHWQNLVMGSVITVFRSLVFKNRFLFQSTDSSTKMIIFEVFQRLLCITLLEYDLTMAV